MVSIELVKDRKTREPATQETTEIRKRFNEHSQIIMSCGVLPNTMRIMFPLVIK
jgi:4-aminobutyrate aminotransferase/(S)-3-amino-2-methylpropionate transaminase